MSASPMLPPPMNPTRLPLTLMRPDRSDGTGADRRSRCRPGPWSRPPRSPPRSRRSSPSTARAARACRPSRAGGGTRGATSSARSTSGGMAISPRTRTWESVPIVSSASPTASGAKPPLLASLATFTCSSASTTRPCAAARRSSSCASSRRSRDWMRSNSGSASLTLLVCRWPIRCHGTGRPSSATLALASCTRFSPSAPRPAARAARMRSTSTTFETPMRSTSSGVRPARSAARATRSRTRSRFAAMSSMRDSSTWDRRETPRPAATPGAPPA